MRGRPLQTTRNLPLNARLRGSLGTRLLIPFDRVEDRPLGMGFVHRVEFGGFPFMFIHIMYDCSAFVHTSKGVYLLRGVCPARP